MKNCDIFLIFAQNIGCVYTLEPPRCLREAVLTSTHNLCFRAKLSKNANPCKPQFIIQKWGGRGCSLHEHVILMSEEKIFENG